MNKRTLVVKLGAIGDVIMALPVLDAIWREHPEEEVVWMVGRVAAPILETVKSAQLKLIVVDERAILRGKFRERIFAILKAWRLLGLSDFRRILIMNGDRRYGLLTLLCRGPRLWFRNGDGFRGAVPGRHHSVEYVRMVTGKDADAVRPTYPSTEPPSLPEDLERALAKVPKPFVVMTPGGAKNVMREDGLRRWTPEGYREVILNLRRSGIPTVLAGGPDDGWVSKAFADLCILDLVGKLPLGPFLTVLSRASVLVTHDSGPLHMGDLVGTPVVGLFGPTSPNELGLIHSRNVIFWGGEGLPCRPCYDGKNYAKCSTNRCLREVTPEMVTASIFRILGR